MSGEPPRVVGAAPFARPRDGELGAMFTASTLEISDDLRAIDARGLTLAMPGATVGPTAGARLLVNEATIHGMTPLGRASNLSTSQRALVLGASAVAMAAFAAASVLRRGIRGASSLALGTAGSAAALLTFSSLERSVKAPALYAAVPLAGLVAMAVLGGILGHSRR